MPLLDLSAEGAFRLPIDIDSLENQLIQMAAEGAPGRDFCQAISELAHTGRFLQLRDALPAIIYDELWVRYRENPSAFVAGWRTLAGEMHRGFIEHARQRLTSLMRIQRAQEDIAQSAWQEIQRALDAQQNDLLRAAFAFELLLRRGRPLSRRNLLHEVNNNLQITGIAPDFPRVANQVNDAGRKAVHQSLLSGDEARTCLQNARQALQLLLGH